MHCANAYSAIHLASLAHFRRGADAGLALGQSSEWCFAEREKQRRLQKRKGQTTEDGVRLEVVGHERVRGDVGSRGVLQKPHAAEDV